MEVFKNTKKLLQIKNTEIFKPQHKKGESMKQTTYFILCLLFCTFSTMTFFSHAESNESSAEQSLKPVKELAVKALNEAPTDTEHHIAVTVITKEDILKCVGCDFTDVLERAGVQVRRFHSQFHQSSDTDTAYVSLRGMSDAQIALEVDGVRQQDNMIGEAIWPFIPLNHIARIEVVRGPQSAYVGDSAKGGVIRVFTEKADCLPEEVCAMAQADISNKFTTGNTAYISANTRTELSGIRLGIQLDKSSDPEKTDDYKEQAFTFNFDHRSTDDKWLIEGSAVIYNNHNEGEPLPLVGKGDSMLTSLGTTYYISPDLLFRNLLGYNEEQQFYTDDFTKYTSGRLSIKLFGEYHFQLEKVGKYILTTGLEQKIERINSDPDNVYDSKKRDTSSIFANIRGENGPLTYQVAIRADDLSGDIKKKIFTWDGNASYYIARLESHDIFLQGGAGTGFRAPGFDEQYLTTFSPSDEEDVFGYLTQANPDLHLEHSATYEVGVRIEKVAHYFLDIIGFNTDLKNAVFFGEKEEELIDEEHLIYITPLKQGKDTKIQGVEVQARWTLNPWTGRIGYTYTKSPNGVEHFRGMNPVKHLGFIGVDYILNPNTTFGAEMLHRGERADQSVSGDKVNLFGVYASYNLYENANIKLAVENLTNKQYDLYNSTNVQGRILWFSVNLKY